MTPNMTITNVRLQKIDDLVAEHIMGWRWVHFVNATKYPGTTCDGFDSITLQSPTWCERTIDGKQWEYATKSQMKLPVTGRGGCPAYSSEEGQIFSIVAAMRKRGFLFAIGDLKCGTWVARFKKPGVDLVRGKEVEEEFAPLAVCVAALAALDVSIP